MKIVNNFNFFKNPILFIIKIIFNWQLNMAHKKGNGEINSVVDDAIETFKNLGVSELKINNQ